METLKKPDVATNEASGLSNNTESNYNRPELKLIHDALIKVIGDKQPLIDSGIYEFAYHSRWLGYLYGGKPKLMMVFRVVTIGPAFGKKLYRCFNLKGLNKKRGDFSVGRRGDFYYEYVKLFGIEPDDSRISMTPFKNVIIKASVRIVDTDYKQRLLPESMRYSVIKELLTVEAGDPNL